MGLRPQFAQNSHNSLRYSFLPPLQTQEQVRFEDVSPSNLKALKSLNGIIFPIIYQVRSPRLYSKNDAQLLDVGQKHSLAFQFHTIKRTHRTRCTSTA